MKKIRLIYTHYSSFVKKDYEILCSEYLVNTSQFNTDAKWQVPFSFIKQLFILLFSSKPDYYVIQFSGYHSLLPSLIGKIFKIPVMIVSGGNDCHYFPEIRYGNYAKRLLAFFTKKSFELSDLICPKHESLWLSNYSYDETIPSPQGIKARIPDLHTPHLSIPNGYDLHFWNANDSQAKTPNSFLTVTGNLHFPFQLQLKGIDLILKSAKLNPQFNFTIVGSQPAKNDNDLLPNVQYIAQTNPVTLRKLYSSHQYYLQLSMAEGFPNSLCEAILCGCIPIGSNVFSIPEIIDDERLILNERSSDKLNAMLVEITSKYLSYKETVSERFSLEIRKKKLLAAIKSLD